MSIRDAIKSVMKTDYEERQCVALERIATALERIAGPEIKIELNLDGSPKAELIETTIQDQVKWQDEEAARATGFPEDHTPEEPRTSE